MCARTSELEKKGNSSLIIISVLRTIIIIAFILYAIFYLLSSLSVAAMPIVLLEFINTQRTNKLLFTVECCLLFINLFFMAYFISLCVCNVYA